MKYRELIEEFAKDYVLDPLMLASIIQQESQFNAEALRYEPLYKYLYKVDHFASHALISWDTEMVTQKISWGLAQIMGALAREQGHEGFMAELLEPEINIKHLCTRISALRKISRDPHDLLAMYNGGLGARNKLPNGNYRNQGYVDSVMKHWESFRAN